MIGKTHKHLLTPLLAAELHSVEPWATLELPLIDSCDRIAIIVDFVTEGTIVHFKDRSSVRCERLLSWREKSKQRFLPSFLARGSSSSPTARTDES